MSYREVSNWPPAWVGRNTKQLEQPSGEIGFLKNVILSQLEPISRFYLMIEHEGEEYLGALLFDDHFFCRHIYKLLANHRATGMRG